MEEQKQAPNFIQTQTLMFQLGSKAVVIDVEGFIDQIVRFKENSKKLPSEDQILENVKAQAHKNIDLIMELAESLKPFQAKYKDVMVKILSTATPQPVKGL